MSSGRAFSDIGFFGELASVSGKVIGSHIFGCGVTFSLMTLSDVTGMGFGVTVGRGSSESILIVSLERSFLTPSSCGVVSSKIGLSTGVSSIKLEAGSSLSGFGVGQAILEDGYVSLISLRCRKSA